MSNLTSGAMFAGYGGLDLAVHEVLGATPAWVAEIESGPARILETRFPDAPNLGDVTAVDWATVEPVDIITGGFPCQDVSHAGKRAGLRDGNRTGLWSRMAEAIDTIRPHLVVAENVRGLLSAEADGNVEPCPWCLGEAGDGEPPVRALGAVLADLAELGYDAAWCGLRAADVGAPHGRFRVFVLAWPAEGEGEGLEAWREGRPGGGAPGLGGRAAGLTLLRTPTAQLAVNGGSQHPDKRREGGHGPTLADEVEHLLPTPAAQEPGGTAEQYHARLNGLAHARAFGQYAPAIARWETVLSRPAPAPTEPTGRGGTERLSPRFVEWLMGLPDGWVTDIGLTRNEQLKALGNGVVPQQAAAAIRHLLGVRAAALAGQEVSA